MIGNFLTRGLVMVFGYAYPAYECYKTVERNKPEIDQLRFWCQYWILVALMTVFERVGDTFVSWLPMYSEAKLAFIIYLWYPRTKGTTFVYDSFFKPYVSKHETEIDRNLLELRTRAGDMAFMYCQKVASYGQTRIFEVLQYVAAQSTPRPRAPQPQTPVSRPRQPPVNAATSRQPPVNAATSRQPTARSQATPPQPQPVDEVTPSPTSSTSSSQQEKEVEEELSSSQGASISSCAPVSRGPSFSANAPAARGPTTSANAPAARGQSISANSPAARGPTTSANASPLKKSVSLPTAPVSPERSSQTVATNAEDAMQIEPVPSKVDKSVQKSIPSPQETVMDEAIRLTRGRLRKTRSATTK